MLSSLVNINEVHNYMIHKPIKTVQRVKSGFLWYLFNKAPEGWPTAVLALSLSVGDN